MYLPLHVELNIDCDYKKKVIGTCKQFDDIGITIKFINQSTPINLEKQTLYMYAKISNIDTIVETKYTKVNKNTVLFNLNNAFTSKTGEVEYEIHICDSDYTVRTSSFFINVKKGTDFLDSVVVNPSNTNIANVTNKEVKEARTATDESEHKTLKERLTYEFGLFKASIKNKLDILDKTEIDKITKKFEEINKQIEDLAEDSSEQVENIFTEILAIENDIRVLRDELNLKADTDKVYSKQDTKEIIDPIVQNIGNQSVLIQAISAAVDSFQKQIDDIIESALDPNIVIELQELLALRLGYDGTKYPTAQMRFDAEIGALNNNKLDKSGGTVSGNLTVNGDMSVGSKMLAQQGFTANKQIFELSRILSYLYLGNAENTTVIETKDHVCINNYNNIILTTNTAYNKTQVDSFLDNLNLKINEFGLNFSNQVRNLNDKVESYIPMFAYMLDVLVRHQVGLENIQEDFHEINTLLNSHVIDRIKTLEERLGVTPPSTNPKDKPRRPIISWVFEPYYQTSNSVRFETDEIPFGIQDHYNLTKAGLRESAEANSSIGGTWYQNNWGYARTVIALWKTDIPGWSDNLTQAVKIALFNNWWVSNVDWISTRRV